MHTLVRYSTAIAVSVAVTFGLFFLMQVLIASSHVKLNEDDKSRNIELVKVDPDEDIQRKERVERPPEQVQPPKLEIPKVTNTGPTKTVFNFDLPRGPQTIQGSGLNTGDGEYLPIVKVNPIYPPRAAGRGLEGFVLVEYTVNRDGTVRDVVVIDADPPGVFNRAAMSAARKYIYKPRVIDGTPVEVHGVRTRITFELEDG